MVIPTNVPMRRDDLNDLVYLTREEKFEAIIEDVRACIDTGAPVLVGTASVETSEELSQAFKKHKIDHKVLNAKYHEQEAEIIAQAGRPGVVTIATNMAGRGTDIVLGGNLEAELASQGETLDEATRERLTADWQARHDAIIEAGVCIFLAPNAMSPDASTTSCAGAPDDRATPGFPGSICRSRTI